MSAISEKVQHVRRAGQSRDHTCHWPGCERQVPPAMWGCKEHWFKLPSDLRGRIWRAYRVGQEEDGRPSRAYLDVAREAQEWIAKHLPRQPTTTTECDWYYGGECGCGEKHDGRPRPNPVQQRLPL